MTEFNDDDDGVETSMKIILVVLKGLACVLAAFVAVLWISTGSAPWDIQQ